MTLLNHSLWSIGILGGCACGAASVGSPPNCRRVPRNRSAAPEKTLCVRRAREASLPPEGGAWVCDFPAIGDPTDDTSATGLDAAELSSPSLGVTSEADTESEFPPKSEPWPGAPDALRGEEPTGTDVELNPAAGRSASKPDPARLSPPIEDKTDRVVGASPEVDCL